MAVITSGNHPKALWPGVKTWWGRFYNEHQKEYVNLFDGDTSDKSYEEDVQTTGFGLAPVKSQSQSVQYDSEQQGYISRMTHVAYALGYIVTKEEMDDNLYEKVSKTRTQALAFSMNQTKETVAANIYNRAFNSSYTGGDAKELLATDHPNSTGGTFSNELATPADLSETAIEDLVIQIMGAQNDRGLQINLMPQSLIVPRQVWFEANRIVKSTLQSNTANNNINAIKDLNIFPKGIILNHYLTDTDAWFIRTNAPRGMIHYTRKAIEFTKDNDFDTENAKAKAYERYSFGWTDPRGLYGSAGA